MWELFYGSKIANSLITGILLFSTCWCLCEKQVSLSELHLQEEINMLYIHMLFNSLQQSFTYFASSQFLACLRRWLCWSRMSLFNFSAIKKQRKRLFTNTSQAIEQNTGWNSQRFSFFLSYEWKKIHLAVLQRAGAEIAELLQRSLGFSHFFTPNIRVIQIHLQLSLKFNFKPTQTAL